MWLFYCARDFCEKGITTSTNNAKCVFLTRTTETQNKAMMMKLRPCCYRAAASSMATREARSSHHYRNNDEVVVVVVRSVKGAPSTKKKNKKDVSTAATRSGLDTFFNRRMKKTTTMETRETRIRSGNVNASTTSFSSSFSTGSFSLFSSAFAGENNKRNNEPTLLQGNLQSRRNTMMDVRAFASGSGKKKNKATNKKKGAKKEEEDDSDIAWEEEEEDEEEDEGEVEDINVVYANYDEKDVQGGNIDTASTSWGELALECVRVVLADEKNIEEFEGNLQLFAFKAIPSTKRIMISVDDLDDQYGSPNLDDLIAVSRKLNELVESKGFPDDVAIEVASPGAERKLTIPEDLSRFRELKMKVTYNDDENDNPENETMILNVEDFEEENGLVVFRLADVQENRPPKKGMPMSKKKKEWRKKVKYVDITSANLYIDTAI